MKHEKYRKIILFGIIGLIGSLGVGFGEFLLHYSPDGIGYDGSNFEFFNQISLDRLTVGHFIAVAFVPLYIGGYYHLFLVFGERNPKIAAAILSFGIFAFLIGGMWVSSRVQLGYLVHYIDKEPNDFALIALLDVYRVHSEVLVSFLRIFMVVISILFIIPIINNNTIYPRWMAFLNPLFLLVLIILTYKIIPTIGFIIGPIAMNVAHFIIFFTSIFIIKIKQK